MMIYLTHILKFEVPPAGLATAVSAAIASKDGHYSPDHERRAQHTYRGLSQARSLELYHSLREPVAPYTKTKTNKARYQRDDILYKAILEDLFEDFLRFMIPDAENLFDFSRKFDFLSQELEQLFPPQEDTYKVKTIDKLVRVYTKDGLEEFVLIHIEIQDKYKGDFSRRMFNYYSRIFDKHDKPITAFAILTESVKKSRSNSFQRSCLGTSLVYTYNALKISQQNEKELEASNNPFAKVILIAKAALNSKKLHKEVRDDFLMEVKMKLAKHLLSKKMAREKIEALLQFLMFHVRFDDQTNTKIFEQELNKITKEKTTMGIKELILERAMHEGELKGELKKQLEIARELKKEGLSVAFISKTTKLSVKKIKEL